MTSNACVRAALVLALFGVLTACGLKGDLYIPEQQPATTPQAEQSGDRPGEPAADDEPAEDGPGDD